MPRDRIPAACRAIRVDLQQIARMVAPGGRVLEVGCGDGALLDPLVHPSKSTVGAWGSPRPA